MKLIVGLGNPGKEYERTRHNAGWRAVRMFHALQTESFGGWQRKFDADVSEGRIGGGKVALMMPRTYMNSSGDAVIQATQFWKVAPADILIVSDELNLPVGTIRLHAQGSAGGHNGLASVLERLGTQEVPRLRIGVGSERTKTVPMEAFVLEPFSTEEETEIDKALQRAAEAIGAVISKGLTKSQNEFNI